MADVYRNEAVQSFAHGSSSASYQSQAKFISGNQNSNGQGSSIAAIQLVSNANGNASSALANFEGYVPQEPVPIDITSLQLPPPNMNCYHEPPTPQGETKVLRHEEAPITKTVVQNFNSLKTVVKENTIHHQHNKTVVTHVNRNHWHTQRVVVKDNHYHHHLTNNVIKVADIHHQKIEQVRGESKTINDYKQTQRIEPAQCIRENDAQPPQAQENCYWTRRNY